MTKTIIYTHTPFFVLKFGKQIWKQNSLIFGKLSKIWKENLEAKEAKSSKSLKDHNIISETL